MVELTGFKALQWALATTLVTFQAKKVSNVLSNLKVEFCEHAWWRVIRRMRTRWWGPLWASTAVMSRRSRWWGSRNLKWPEQEPVPRSEQRPHLAAVAPPHPHPIRKLRDPLKLSKRRGRKREGRKRRWAIMKMARLICLAEKICQRGPKPKEKYFNF